MGTIMLGFIRGVLKSAWTILDFTRRALANVLLLVIAGVLVGVIFLEERTPDVPARSILTIDLAGEIVEHGDFSGSGAIGSVFSGSEPQTRLRDVLAGLNIAATDPSIEGVLMRLDDLEGAGLATLREIGAQMDRFKSAGKRITVWATGYNQQQYAIAAHASEVYVHPMGQVLLKGISTNRLYWGETLRRLGVTVHVFKAGDYKSSPESFVLKAPSRESLEADRFWIKDVWSQYANAIESARGLMPGAVDALIGDYPARLAKAKGDMSRVALNESLVDGVTTLDETQDMLVERQGGRKGVDALRTVSLSDYLAARVKAPSSDKRIAVVTIEGEIKDGADAPGMTGARSAVQLIREARSSEQTAALVVRIDSPGGSAVASELIRRELELVRKAGKPVVASMGDYAASGGYWIATAADRIIADPMSITGSIGVFGIVPRFDKTLAMVDIGTGGASTSWLASAESPLQDMSPGFEKMMQLSVARTYRDFVRLVAQGRHMSEKRVTDLAQGRVYTGRQAQERGLADSLGGVTEAVEEARRLAKAPGADLMWLEKKEGRLSMLFNGLFGGLAKIPAAQSLLHALAGERLMLRGLDPGTAALLTGPAAEAARFAQMVREPESLYAHCLCSRPF